LEMLQGLQNSIKNVVINNDLLNET
jgi:hypothetical protein